MPFDRDDYLALSRLIELLSQRARRRDDHDVAEDVQPRPELDIQEYLQLEFTVRGDR